MHEYAIGKYAAKVYADKNMFVVKIVNLGKGLDVSNHIAGIR